MEDEVFRELVRAQAAVEAARGELELLPNLKGPAVRKVLERRNVSTRVRAWPIRPGLCAWSLTPRPFLGLQGLAPQALRNLAEEVLREALTAAESSVTEVRLRVVPPCPPPQLGQPLRRGGRLWRYDWQACDYRCVSDDDLGDGDDRQGSRQPLEVKGLAERARVIVIETIAALADLLE